MAFEGLISRKRKSVEGTIVDDVSGTKWKYMINFEIANTEYTFQGGLFAPGPKGYIEIRRRTEPGHLALEECDRFGLNVAKDILRAHTSHR